MIPEVNLAYAFPFQIKYKVYYFVTETTDGNDVNDDEDPQIDSASSTDAEDSDEDVQIGKFSLFPTNLNLNLYLVCSYIGLLVRH